MKALLDTNVILDVLLCRSPHDKASLRVFSAVEQGELDACICATSVTTIHYLLEKGLGARAAHREIGKLLSLFEVAPVGGQTLKSALGSKFSDYEDAVIYQAAREAGAALLVTRNTQDSKASDLPVFTPEGFLLAMEARMLEEEER